MEYSNKLFIRSQPFLKSSSYPQQQQQQFHNNRKFLTRDYYYKDSQQFFNEHVKRNFKSSSVNSASGSEPHMNSANSPNSIENHINNNDNVVDATNNHLVAQHELSESWLELILSLTFSGIIILGVVIVGVILFIWLRRHFREASKWSKHCRYVEDKESVVRIKDRGDKSKRKNKSNNYISAYGEKKMNSRKWLGRNQQPQTPEIDSNIVDDLEQRLETVKFKNSPPTSPNNEKCSNDDDEIDDDCYMQQQRQICERDASVTVYETKNFEDFSESLNDEENAKILIPCPPLPVTDFHPQPPASPYFDTASIITESKSPPSSPLTMLNEEIHNVQPQAEDMTTMTVKSFKSIATSPPPFSPIIHQHHNTFSKYTTTGTQTYFTKAPNSPNNHLLNSQFAVLQTPTTSYCPTGNPFASSENKENKEPLKRCINKTITSLKQDNSGGSTTGEKCISGVSTAQQQHINSSPSSPSSVIPTSPKILGEQNSPETKFIYSPKTASTNLSPSISSASYKFGNYFRFPDVGTPPVTVEKSSSISSTWQSSMSECGETTSADMTLKSIQSMESTDKENIILKIDEVDSPVESETKTMSSPTTQSSMGNNNNNNNHYSINNNNNNNNYSSGNTLTIRRARLKSISLDSDGARLVEENLTRPVEEIVEMTTYKPSDELTTDDDSTMTSANNNNDRINPKNIFNLTINLNSRDNSLDSTSVSNDVNMNNPSNDDDFEDEDESGDEICRTPTMKYFAGKKAVSLDSDHHQEGPRVGTVKTVSTETFQYYFGQSGSGKLNNSISVPSTPKHLTSNKLKISQGEERSSHSSCSRYNQRKLGSFEENKMQSQTYKSNLTTSIQTLNVSSSNLKTLPEISSISDFEGQSPKSIAMLPRPIGIPPSKSGILQRRGSNTSLTLNLNSSCGNLTRGLSCSNYSLGNINGSNLNINQPRVVSNIKKSLLQRRGSNTSLTLNVQDSNNHLNRFNSHSSLNISGGSKQNKGLLERRNSNASLTLNIQNRGLSISNVNLRGSECSLSSVNTNQMAEIMMMEHEETEEIKKEVQEETCRQRKFLSSENLHNLSIHRTSQNQRTQSQHTPYGSIDNLKQHSQPYHQIPVICTKPLSPQTTSEDFKIYLANIQFLQSASNVLNAESLTTLNTLFQNSYNTRPKVAQHLNQNQVQFYNDDVLNSKTTSLGISSNFSPDEEQKEKLIKLHHEFWNLPTNYQEKPMVFGSQPKNRYKTILPNEHSRVILQKEEGSIQEPYINANYIKGPDFAVNPDASHAYIATQGPMTNTVYEFWLMTQQNVEKCDGNGIQKIVMLTDFVESARQKCATYFPTELDDVVVFTNSSSLDDENLVKESIDKIIHFEEKEEEEVFITSETVNDGFNFFVIKNFGVKHKNGYSIRKLRVYHGTQKFEKPKEFDVYHYWFPDWPDHRSPEDIDVLLDLSLDILDGNCLKDFEEESEDSHVNSERSPYPIIHCSAGIGRTGCLAAILNGLRQIRSNSEEVSVDILGIVCNLRLQRGGMVQNSEQYELIHRSICLFHHKLSTQKLKDLQVDDSQ